MAYIVIISLLLFPIFCGITEAIYDHQGSLSPLIDSKELNRYKHSFSTLSRLCFFSLMLVLNLYLFFASLCVFTFLHGVYYITRNYLVQARVYKYGVFSMGSTALTEKIFNPIVRTILFIIGIILIIKYFIG